MRDGITVISMFIMRCSDLGGGDSTSNAINNHGSVVGSSLTTEGVQHPFLYSPGKQSMIDLDLPKGYSAGEAVDVNDINMVVGNAYADGDKQGSIGFVWTPELGMRDLNEFVDTAAGSKVRAAYRINNGGEILAQVETKEGSGFSLLRPPG